jgi:hypothetical protein
MSQEPHVLEVESVDESVLITFDNGRSGLYPSSLLWSVFSQVDEQEPDQGESF